jgi:hypothetical protein
MNAIISRIEGLSVISIASRLKPTKPTHRRHAEREGLNEILVNRVRWPNTYLMTNRFLGSVNCAQLLQC